MYCVAHQCYLFKLRQTVRVRFAPTDVINSHSTTAPQQQPEAEMAGCGARISSHMSACDNACPPLYSHSHSNY